MKIDQKVLSSIFAAVSLLSKSKVKIVFEVTGINKEGKDGKDTYMNGDLQQLPVLLEYFDNLKSGTLWLANENKDGYLGKRTMVCRKVLRENYWFAGSGCSNT